MRWKPSDSAKRPRNGLFASMISAANLMTYSAECPKLKRFYPFDWFQWSQWMGFSQLVLMTKEWLFWTPNHFWESPWHGHNLVFRSTHEWWQRFWWWWHSGEGHNHDEDDESGGDDENESFDGKDGTSNGVTGWFGRFNFFLGAHHGPRVFFAPYDIFTCLCYMFKWQT